MKTLANARESAKRISPAVAVVLIVIVAAFVFAPPFSFEIKAKSVAYGICHQIPARSFFLAGNQLPLCARNTGIFLGALLTFVALYFMGKGRRAELPPPRVLVVMGLFTTIMGADGVNSYITFFPGVPHLYEPSNFLRLATGSFHGITMALLMFPMFNSVLWKNAEPKPVVEGLRGLLPFMALMAVLIGVVAAQLDFLYYPLATAMVAAVLIMVIMINATLVQMVLRWENTASTWRDAASPLLVALVLSFAELAILGAIRTQLTIALGLPF